MLVDDGYAIAFALVVHEQLVGQVAQRQHAGIGRKRRQTRFRARARDAAEHLGAGGVPAPPRAVVARPGLGAQCIGLVPERCDLVAGEPGANERIAGCPQEVRQLLARIVEGERTLHVERLTRRVPEIERLRIIQRAAGVEREQGGLPGHEVDRTTAEAADAALVEKPGRRFELVDQPDPVGMVQLDDGLGGVVSRYDLEPPGGGPVGVRAPAAEAQREAAEAARRSFDERLATPGQRPSDLLAVVAIEVE
jgi:hypothetical protein